MTATREERSAQRLGGRPGHFASGERNERCWCARRFLWFLRRIKTRARIYSAVCRKTAARFIHKHSTHASEYAWCVFFLFDVDGARDATKSESITSPHTRNSNSSAIFHRRLPPDLFKCPESRVNAGRPHGTRRSHSHHCGQLRFVVTRFRCAWCWHTDIDVTRTLFASEALNFPNLFIVRRFNARTQQ